MSGVQIYEGETRAWKAPALRISSSEYRRLLAKDAVMVLDVRDDKSYRLGHIPGVQLNPPTIQQPASVHTQS